MPTQTNLDKPAKQKRARQRKPSPRSSAAATAAAPSLAGFDFAAYNDQFRHRASATAYNDAASYEARIEMAAVTPGQTYWKVIGVHHLSPVENRDRHNAFIDVLDENGQRIKDGSLRIGWTWEGRQPDESAAPKALDKPDSEPATDIPIEKNMTVTLWLDGAGISDRVVGLHTRHEDEVGADGSRNSRFHHSFYIVFQHTQATAAGEDSGNPPSSGAFRFEHWPTEQRRLIQVFGVNPANYERFGLPGHEGVDIEAAAGSKIFAVARGQVKMVYTKENYAQNWHPYGVHVRLLHVDDYETIYAHFQEPNVQVGQSVEAGEVLGLADHTGNVSGDPPDHLHLTLKHKGEATPGYPNNIIDPLPFLQPLLGGDRVGVASASSVGAIRLADKLGLNCNAPIDSNGNITPRLTDPNLIKETGVTWVRLNFIVRPFSGPDDPTWVATYRKIITDLRRAGLQIYGLIHAEAVDHDPGNQFRDEPPGTPDNDWIRRYAANFRGIVELFRNDVPIFESFNEPNNWHRTPADPTQWSQSWIQPAWFAIMLQRVYESVRDLDVTLVSGPLLSTEDGNSAADYLPQVYAAGRQRFGWGQGNPVPFDGVGFHPYVLRDPPNPHIDIPARYEAYMGAFRAIIRTNEGKDKPIYLSEIGWQNAEDRQSACMEAGLTVALDDPSVALCIWYGMQDDSEERYGLFRNNGLSVNERKPIFERFKRLAATQRSVPMARILRHAPSAKFIGEFDNVPDKTVLEPGRSFTKVWRMENTGTTGWGEGYHFVSVEGPTLGAAHMLPIAPCRPGETVDITVSFVAPLEAGNYKSTWSLADPSQNLFGDLVWTEFQVAAAPPVAAPVMPAQAAAFPRGLEGAVPSGVAALPGLPASAVSPAEAPLVAMALGIIYQTYWMRVLAAAAEPNPQQAMQAAADDALARIEALMGSGKV